LETTPQATSIWNPGCVDLLRAPALQLTEAARLAMVDDNGGLDYANLLRGAFGDAADLETCGGACPNSHPFCYEGACVVPTCDLIRPFCPSPTTGVRARQLCPLTCGCDDPFGQLALALPEAGCSAGCARTDRYLSALDTAPCADLNWWDPRWVNLTRSIGVAAQSWPSSWRFSALGDGAMTIGWLVWFQMAGCAAIHAMRGNQPGFNFCTEGGTYFALKPLSYYCPVSCSCTSNMLHCPSTCTGNETVVHPAPASGQAAMDVIAHMDLIMNSTRADTLW